MITVQVEIKLPKPLTVAQAREVMSSSAPNYQGIDGLVRKYYMLSEDGETAGGLYLWESRAQAEKMYDAAWHATVAEKYGSPPSVTYFETPVIVDNVTGEISVGRDVEPV